MANNARTKSWLALSGVALVIAAMAAVPALSGTASAAPAPSAAGTNSTSSQQWAYGGMNWTNGTSTFGNSTVTWNASFGWTVVFTATNTSNATVMLEEARTVGVQVDVTYTGPISSAQYRLSAHEADVAFANVTYAATVYANGGSVPALGLENAAASATASLAQSLSARVGANAYDEFVNESGSAQVSVQFAPALGLIPLNLSGVHTWNATSTATPAASWSFASSWSAHGPNATSGANATRSGSWNATTPVSLTGFQVDAPRLFHDHQSRTGIVLILHGGAELYDGFIVVPHGFDLFGGGGPSVPVASGAASIASGETLYLTPGPVSVSSLSAAQATFGTTTVSAPVAASAGGVAPAALGSPTPGNTVTAQPMSVAAAESQANCLQNGCAAASATGLGGGLLVALVAAVVVAAAALGFVGWRASAGRRQPPASGEAPKP